jgi:hypothetical protein
MEVGKGEESVVHGGGDVTRQEPKTEEDIKSEMPMEKDFILPVDSDLTVYRCFQNTIQQNSSFSFPSNEKINVFNNKCCYLFHVPSLQQIFVWIGRRSCIEDSQFIDKILPDLINDFKCTKSAVIWRRLDDSTPSSEFQSLLSTVTIDKKEPKKNDPIRVFQYQTSSSSSSSSPSTPRQLQLLATFNPDSVSYSSKLPMSILDDQLTLVIESGINIYIWLGQHCQLPPDLAMIRSQFSEKRVQTIAQDKEPLLFRVLFHDWDSKKIINSYSTAVVSGEGVGSPIGTARRKSLVAERRKSFTKNNSVPDISSILPQRQGSFYTKAEDDAKGHQKWSLVTRSASSDDHAAGSHKTTIEDEAQAATPGAVELASPHVQPFSQLEEKGESKSAQETREQRSLTEGEGQNEAASVVGPSLSSVPTEVPAEPLKLLSEDKDPLAEEATGEDLEAKEPLQGEGETSGNSVHKEDPPVEEKEEQGVESVSESQKEVAMESHNVPESELLTNVSPTQEVSDVMPKTEHDNEIVRGAVALSPKTTASHATTAATAKQPKQDQRQESLHRSRPADSERNHPSTIPIHQKNQCFCM